MQCLIWSIECTKETIVRISGGLGCAMAGLDPLDRGVVCDLPASIQRWRLFIDSSMMDLQW